ncbi:MAG: nucleotide exchange factor GrpE [Desulfovibrionaceae bacterium]|nr:nucleotide exchange factor GrpE [Desulfovibrionaceae bacterium]
MNHNDMYEDNKEHSDVQEDLEQEVQNSTEDVIKEGLLEEVEKQRAMSDMHMNMKREESIENERLRMLADMENFKKRLLREQEEQSKFLTEKVISSLLPSLDNLSLALQYGSNIPQAKDFYMGVEMTYKSLLESLKSFGFSSVGTVGDEFDPAVCEAVATEKKEGVKPNVIIQVLQVGYLLNGRTLRPAKVVISA